MGGMLTESGAAGQRANNTLSKLPKVTGQANVREASEGLNKSRFTKRDNSLGLDSIENTGNVTETIGRKMFGEGAVNTSDWGEPQTTTTAVSQNKTSDKSSTQVKMRSNNSRL